ncbi:hypothetical protein AQUCO_01100225v1 [Aquilegia coerulea]|uniref:Protein kinase domain-containing protein n=1 Tax=Aquilegia coerulea TaxID=218851 RepID=A0A2G5E648_AQUCA|nr:hypothetical protein AQUCO_01100225v1 [Aquilegia coerulea]
MSWCLLFLLVVYLSWGFFIFGNSQLQSSQTQVLQQLRKHLEYPQVLESWNDYKDLCYLPPSSQMSIVCQGNSISELKIMGDKPAKVSKFDIFPIPNLTLSDGFSIDSFVTTLARLTTLRVLSLVSLGMWGSLPDKIHRLQSLESLDLCSNFLYGSIPPQISRMVKLQILSLDENFFNGTIPDWFDSFSNLTILSLKSNYLEGTFPTSIGKSNKLVNLALSHNVISGKLPDLSSLTSLHVLDLRENKLESELPMMPKGLVNALLSKNLFSGEIPQHFGKLSQLQHLDMSFNLLEGTPPAKLFALPNISYLNLASNMLTGSLPEHLTCSGVLGFVDISNNRLKGGLPTCLRSSSGNRVVKFGGNCLSLDLQNQHKSSYCENKMTAHGSAGKSLGVLIAVILGIVVLVSILAFCFLYLFRRYCPRGTSEQHLLRKGTQDNSVTTLSSELLASARFVSEASKLGTQSVPLYRLFTVRELNEATNNFDQSMFLGKGSLGEIYKGRLDNGAYVAIRCLALFKRHSIRNLKLRLDLLSKLRHPNLVCLLGHCIDGERDDSSINRVFLVYEYIPNGDLHGHLSETSPEKVLKWSERLAILIGIAKAVHFLHTGMLPGFFNNQLKTKNILLDENRIAKLSDYGLSIITNEIDKHGAKGEEKVTWQITKLKDDVFSFGFILLEMLVGPTTARKGESYLLNEMASFGSQDGRRRMVDPVVLSTCSEESLLTVISITNKCISTESTNTHPSFEDVLWNLQYAEQVQTASDGDQRSEISSQP